MILLIDIGNTLTKIALAKEINNSFLLINILPTKNNNWNKEINKILSINKNKIENSIISSVVPNKLLILKKIIKAIFNFNPIILNFKLIEFLPLKIKLNQKQIGNDLISLAIASYVRFGNSITISMGTATTYTIIKDNTLKGLIIAPGFTSTKISLIKDAALIKPFNVINYSSVLGNSTKHALSIGYGNGFNYMIDGTIKAINKELNSKLKIIVTGGNFQELKPFLKFKYHYEENLVLQGLIIIYQILKKNNKLK